MHVRDFPMPINEKLLETSCLMRSEGLEMEIDFGCSSSICLPNPRRLTAEYRRHLSPSQCPMMRRHPVVIDGG